MKITYKDENEETDRNGTVKKAKKLFNVYTTLFSEDVREATKIILKG